MHLRPPLRGGAGPRAAPPIQVRANKAANRQPVSAPQMADLGGFGAPARWHAPPNSVLSAQFSLYGPRMHSHRGPMRSTAWYGVPHVTSSTFGGLSGSEANGGGCWPPGRPGSPSLASSPAPHGKGRNSRTRWGAAPRAGLRAPRRWRRGGRAQQTNKAAGALPPVAVAPPRARYEARSAHPARHSDAY